MKTEITGPYAKYVTKEEDSKLHKHRMEIFIRQEKLEEEREEECNKNSHSGTSPSPSSEQPLPCSFVSVFPFFCGDDTEV